MHPFAEPVAPMRNGKDWTKHIAYNSGPESHRDATPRKKPRMKHAERTGAPRVQSQLRAHEVLALAQEERARRELGEAISRVTQACHLSDPNITFVEPPL